jgi:hypothetical protein
MNLLRLLPAIGSFGVLTVMLTGCPSHAHVETEKQKKEDMKINVYQVFTRLLGIPTPPTSPGAPWRRMEWANSTISPTRPWRK